jgi:hypothetical protein
VLNDAVALVKMDDRRALAAAGGLTKKGVNAIIDLNRSQHEIFLLGLRR